MKSASPIANALVADPLFPQLKDHVIESTGLNYYADRDVDLAHRIGRRLTSLGMQDCASYLDVLRDPRRGPSEQDVLIAEITIGETYFFRHREHFDALRDVVLPDLMARNSATRRLRIWCAGCAEGAEPYSLAILLRNWLGDELRGWGVTIIGTDINQRALARASEGKFEEWALRATAEDLRQAYFSKEENFWAIRPEYKNCVFFQYHNLAKNAFPSVLNNLFSLDLIVCRNVLIYFGAELMQKTIRQFHQSLVPGAWLLVGPAEPNMTSFTQFRTVNAPGVTLYQKPVEVLAAPALPILAPALPSRASSDSPANCRKTADQGPTIEDIRRHADRGAWQEALGCYEHLLAKDPLNAAVHFYYALVLQQIGRPVEAEASLRRAIYLDRGSVLAHYYLGLVLQSQGHALQAVRSFKNTQELLLAREVTEAFDDADGITVSELWTLANMHVEILTQRCEMEPG